MFLGHLGAEETICVSTALTYCNIVSIVTTFITSTPNEANAFFGSPVKCKSSI